MKHRVVSLLRTTSRIYLSVARLWRSNRGFEDNFLFVDAESALGFAVMNTVIYEAVRQARPQSIITVLASGQSLPALRANPHIDTIVSTQMPHIYPSKFYLKLVRSKMRGTLAPSTLIQVGQSKRISRDLVALAFPTAVLAGDGVLPVYDRQVIYRSERGALGAIRSTIEQLGFDARDVGPKVYFRKEDADRAAELLGDPTRCRIGIVTQVSGGHPNQWYQDRFISVAEGVANAFPSAHIFFLGGASDREAIETVRADLSVSSTSLAGRTTLAELSAVLCQLDLLITLDTGTLHVSRGTEIPTVVIAPAHQPVSDWLPERSSRVAILRRDDIACRECRLFSCLTRECMDEISAVSVIAASLGMLGRFPPSPKERLLRLARLTSPKSPALFV